MGTDPTEALRRRNAKLEQLLSIAKRLGRERRVDELLDHILDAARNIIEADRCTLFVVDRTRTQLVARIAQGLTRSIRIPIGAGSIAGECAHTKRPILIEDAYKDPRFNPDVDRRTGYRTTSILTVPMLDDDAECTGVLQALNRKTGTPFDAEDMEFLLALGAQAAVSIENAQLHEDIIQLFEGFIRASVYAVEARDPTTSGHSERVAILSVGLARAYNQLTEVKQPLSEAQVRELRYAALLHDFGKVGVKEDVLVKANKLYPAQIKELRWRFDYLLKQREVEYLAGQLEWWQKHVEVHEREAALDELTRLHRAARDELEAAWDLVLESNLPNVVSRGGSDKALEALGAHMLVDPRGRHRPLVAPDELANLRIRAGSLNDAERKEIQNHVAYTFKFLSRIPWTRDLERVPEIAGKHHEKLDGTGYPDQVGSDSIPLQTRMMTICDIYDALTARDRPYKKAMPHRRAIEILELEANDQKLDRWLLDLFIQARVYERLYVLES